jgi:hypothetical protein
MAFAGVNCQSESDELALIQWRVTRLSGALGALDFCGPITRQGEVGSGDSLIPTMRLTAAVLSGWPPRPKRRPTPSAAVDRPPRPGGPWPRR